MVCDCPPLHELDPLTDEELVELARADCRPAFDVLIDRHYAAFRGVALKLLKDEADANDIVQTAFMNIYAKLDSYSGDGSFAGWSYRIVRNTALMLLRKRKRRREVDLEDAPRSTLDTPEYADWAADPDRALRNKQIRRAVRLAMDDLEPKYRRVIELREFQGMTMAQMSHELDLSIGGVKTRLHRARSTMRVWLENRYDVRPEPIQ
jgi:RNA polymerase sigma-70 factor (ECF subfamily)